MENGNETRCLKRSVYNFRKRSRSCLFALTSQCNYVVCFDSCRTDLYTSRSVCDTIAATGCDSQLSTRENRLLLITPTRFLVCWGRIHLCSTTASSEANRPARYHCCR